jgi:hypothetical protein
MMQDEPNPPLVSAYIWEKIACESNFLSSCCPLLEYNPNKIVNNRTFKKRLVLEGFIHHNLFLLVYKSALCIRKVTAYSLFPVIPVLFQAPV